MAHSWEAFAEEKMCWQPTIIHGTHRISILGNRCCNPGLYPNYTWKSLKRLTSIAMQKNMTAYHFLLWNIIRQTSESKGKRQEQHWLITPLKGWSNFSLRLEWAPTWGFRRRSLCPARRFRQLLFPSSNSASKWNLWNVQLHKSPETNLIRAYNTSYLRKGRINFTKVK